jgi:NADH dehydrogenase
LGSNGSKPRVLILGSGFGGLGAAQALKDADAEVVLVDAHDYHTFQPLIYQVATDLLQPSVVGHPIRDLFHEQSNVVVHQATAEKLDLDGRQVQFAEIDPITYDHLVLAMGARVNFFGVDGAQEHAFPMYTLADAMRIREHVLERWEAADRDPGLVDDGALNVVIVGGGPTGVESAGAMAELYRANFAKDYPGIPQDAARLTLVEGGPALFTMFKPRLQKYAKEALEKRTVEILLDDVVASVEPTRVHLRSGTVLKTHTLIWGAGLQAHPIATSLGLELQRGDRIPVGPDLSVAGHPEVFAVGDIAWITDTGTGDVLPQLGSVALQSGEHVGATIARRLGGKEPKPFLYKDKGTMATIGRGAAVVQFHGGRSMTGKKASLAWGAVHLALLSKGEERAKAVVEWTWAGFTHERSGRITVHTDEE